MDDPFIIVLTTCPNRTESGRLATTVVERRLAACVQENPITSTYRWEGRIECDDEVRVIMKTRSKHFEEICNVVRDLVSYDNPQVVSVPILDGSPEYLDWILAESSTTGSSGD